MDIGESRVGLLKTTLVNFPGKLATAVFLPGCNLRCGYCYNGELACADVFGQTLVNSENEYICLSEVFEHLKKRRKLLDSLVISGGEPTISPLLQELLRVACSLEYSVKLDTNGLFPEKLETIFKADTSRCITFVALDIKTAPTRYQELLPSSERGFCVDFSERLQKTLHLLSRFEIEKDLKVEYRTVLVPSLVGSDEIESIARLLPEHADWKWARFVPTHCLDPRFTNSTPYTEDELLRLLQHAKQIIKNVSLR